MPILHLFLINFMCPVFGNVIINFEDSSQQEQQLSIQCKIQLVKLDNIPVTATLYKQGVKHPIIKVEWEAGTASSFDKVAAKIIVKDPDLCSGEGVVCSIFDGYSKGLIYKVPKPTHQQAGVYICEVTAESTYTSSLFPNCMHTPLCFLKFWITLTRKFRLNLNSRFGIRRINFTIFHIPFSLLPQKSVKLEKEFLNPSSPPENEILCKFM